MPHANAFLVVLLVHVMYKVPYFRFYFIIDLFNHIIDLFYCVKTFFTILYIEFMVKEIYNTIK
jgi:hypothetical protein